MTLTLSNGLQVQQIQREGFMELVCAGNPDRVLTPKEWDEASALLISENRKRLSEEKATRHAVSVEAYHTHIGHRFSVGTQYKSTGKHSRVCTVVDQLTVTNAAGNVVKRYYKTSHEFAGQIVMEHEVCDTTIARGLVRA